MLRLTLGREKIWAKKFEAERIHFYDIFATVAVKLKLLRIPTNDCYNYQTAEAV